MPSNFNRTTPVAPTGRKNIKWQTDGSGNDSAYYDLFTSVNPQIGTSYAIKDSATTGPTDRGTLVTLTNAAAVAVSIGQAGGSSLFPADWVCFILNRGAGTVTLTPTTSTVNGAATLVLTTNQWCVLFSDGANYEALVYAPATGGGVTALSGVGIITNSSSTGAVTLTVAGTSGGIPYFSSSSGWASSAALTANSPVLGGGAGAAPKTATFLTTDGAATLTIGVAGGGNGVLALAGTTSGVATLTAPAIAGTSTNQIVSSNVIGVPNGSASAAAFGFSGAPSYGFYLTGSQVAVTIGGTSAFSFNPNYAGFGIQAGSELYWTAGAATAAMVSSIYPPTAKSFNFGVNGDATGTVNAALYTAGGSSGVSAGSFSSITAITTVGGIVTQLTGTSDERLKNAIPYEGGLDQVLAIHPVRYTWNKAGQLHTGLSGDKQYVGFLAQDVQRAIPEAITGTEGLEKYLSFDDRPVMAALVKAVQELTSRLSMLEARV